MRTAVSECSRIAYDEHLRSGGLGKQSAAIYLHVIESGRDWSRMEISCALDIPINAICGRVNELVCAGLLVEYPKRKCRHTGRLIAPVGKPRPAQHELPWGQAA